jgi:hypothetical protein
MTSYRFAMDLRDETCGILRAAEVEAFYKRSRRLTTRNRDGLTVSQTFAGGALNRFAFIPTARPLAD